MIRKMKSIMNKILGRDSKKEKQKKDSGIQPDDKYEEYCQVMLGAIDKEFIKWPL